LVLLLFSIERKAFSSTPYKQAFEAKRLYERMPAVLAKALESSIRLNPVPLLPALTAADWQNVITGLLPPEALKAMTNNVLDSIFDYLNGRSSSMVISLLPLKAQLAGPSGMNAVQQILSRQPTCTPDQLLLIPQGLVLCNPPQEMIGSITTLIQSLQNMPNEVTLIPEALSDKPYDPRRALNALRSVIRFSLILPVLLLFSIALFGVRSLRDWLIWWGWPFFLAGYISALIAMVGSPLVGGFLGYLILQGGTLILLDFATVLAETMSDVTLQMIAPVALQGFILGSAGLWMVLFGMILPKPRMNPRFRP
jgi:hypothetical protein